MFQASFDKEGDPREEFDDKQRQIDQLYLNQKWLIDKIHSMRSMLGLSPVGGWVSNTEDLVAHIKSLTDKKPTTQQILEHHNL